MTAPAPILVLGIGNILLGDEGVGVRAIEALSSATLPSDVEIADGGTGGANLLNLIADRDTLIVIDAMDADEPPGTWRRMRADELAPLHTPEISLHEFGLLQTLEMARRLNCAPRDVILYGIQPTCIEPGLELSTMAENAMKSVVRDVLRELSSLSPGFPRSEQPSTP